MIEVVLNKCLGNRVYDLLGHLRIMMAVAYGHEPCLGHREDLQVGHYLAG